jgi:hypothetical protein
MLFSSGRLEKAFTSPDFDRRSLNDRFNFGALTLNDFRCFS